MANFSAKCFIRAPCKINLHLAVGEKRPDGFHNLESVFAALAFGDELCFERTGPDNSLELIVRLPSEAGKEISGLEGENNLISRAVLLFREKTGAASGFRCTLDKKIPLGAGLGGGSSDAASTLIALDYLAGTRLSRGELLEMAASLGSDVPFFLSGGAAWVTGRGEHIQPLSPPGDYRTLLVKPRFSSNTGEAFSLLDKFREKEGNDPYYDKLPPDVIMRAMRRPPEEWPFYNDFLPALPQADTYGEILQALKENGAVFAGLSGSGSCCFGIFRDEKTILTAEKRFKFSKKHQFFTKITFFLAFEAIPVLE